MVELPVPLKDFKYGYEEEGKIKGSKCTTCGHLMVTIYGVCPKCGSTELEATSFKGEGKIEAYTVMTFSTERYLEYAPFAYICIILDEGAKMSGWIPGIQDASEIKIGDRVRYIQTYKPGVVFEKIKEKRADEGEEASAEGPGSEWLSFGA